MLKFFIVIFLICGATDVIAAHWALDLINIKASGTGSPAIASTNRIFRAYPGVEYNIRAAVTGGDYPFTYSLPSAPSGMTIKSRTGEITWSNPTIIGSPHSVTIKVVDNESSEVTATFSIEVTTSGFIFLNSSYSGTESGSISQPYSSIANVIANTTSANITDIVYVRGGSYVLPAGSGELSLQNHPHSWIGYPGETASISGNGRYIRSWDQGIYIDNLLLSGFTTYALQLWGGHNYQTIRRCTFDDIVSSSSDNLNQGFIYSTYGETHGNYTVIQDNEFKNFTGACAIGSLYSINNALIENNYIHSAGGTGITGINSAIAPKEGIVKLTVRGNKVVVSNGWILGHSMNSIMANADDLDVSYNYFNRGNTAYVGSFYQRSDKPQTDVWHYRNTVVGYVGFDRINGSDCSITGDTLVENNVFVNEDGYTGEPSYTFDDPIMYHTTLSSNTPSNCVDVIDNLKGYSAANIIDSDGKLQGAGNIIYVGSRGWQLSDGYTPMELLDLSDNTARTAAGVTFSRASFY